jgi:uncharacterized protein YkvS
MGGKAIQGRDTQIRLFKNGSLTEIVEINNFNMKQDADFKRSEYLGYTDTIGDISHKGWSGDFECEVTNSKIDDLIDALIEENLNRLDIDEITIMDVENYRDGTKSGWLYYGIQLKYSKAASNRDEKVKKKIEWQADRRKKVF